MPRMMWKITNNIIDRKNGEEEIDLVTCCNFREDVPLTQKFRLLDDDKEVYFEGLMEDVDKYGGDLPFAPLLDYGEGGYGCTELQYFKDGVWETL
jgi:hypothetical protein